MKSHRTRLLTLCVLACCLFAVASTASTLDESVSTDPSDAIDPDWETLPIGKEQASELRERTQSEPADAGTPSAETAADSGSEMEEESESSDGSSQSSAEGGTGDANSGGQSGASEGGAAGGQNGGSDGGAAGGQNGESGGDTKVVTASLLARLLELLGPLLLGLLVLAVVGGGMAVLRRLRPDESVTADENPGGLSRAVGSPSPSNGVSRAWFELLRRYGVDDEHQLTPRERAELAIERGADPDSVRALTELFERTRYGDAAVTDGAHDRAADLFEQATAGSGRRRSRSHTSPGGRDSQEGWT